MSSVAIAFAVGLLVAIVWIVFLFVVLMYPVGPSSMVKETSRSKAWRVVDRDLGRSSHSTPLSSSPVLPNLSCMSLDPKVKRYAILCGLNYTKRPEMHLLSCATDVALMAQWLHIERSYPLEQMWIITDEPSSITWKHPHVSTDSSSGHFLQTLQTIVDEIRRYHQAGVFTELFVFFSGHGTSVVSTDARSEEDHRDECLVFMDEAFVTDNRLSQFWVQLPVSNRTFAIFDACHSGTMADLTYRYRLPDRSYIVSASNRRYDAQIVSISGCRDDQTSEASGSFEEPSVLTKTFLDVVQTPESLSKPITSLVEDMNQRLIQEKRQQRPQLTSSYRFMNQLLFSS